MKPVRLGSLHKLIVKSTTVHVTGGVCYLCRDTLYLLNPDLTEDTALTLPTSTSNIDTCTASDRSDNPVMATERESGMNHGTCILHDIQLAHRRGGKQCSFIQQLDGKRRLVLTFTGAFDFQ